MNDAKTFLKQVELCDAHINNKLEELAHLKDLATRITYSLKQDVVSCSGNKDKIGDTVSKIVDIENEIDKSVDRFVDIKRDVESVVSKVSEPDQLELLYKKYFRHESLEQIACEMGYSYRTICYLHGKALKTVERLLNEELR